MNSQAKKGGAALGLLTLLASGSAVQAATTATSPVPKGEKQTTRLDSGKLKACKEKEKSITKRSTQMTQRATKMEEKFSDIAAKVDAYYTTKLVPKGKTVSNYVALKSDIAAKKETVHGEIAKANKDVSSFSCTAEDPKGALVVFGTDMKAVNTALQNYAGATRAFTKAIHQAAGDDAESSPKASASPTAKKL